MSITNDLTRYGQLLPELIVQSKESSLRLKDLHTLRKEFNRLARKDKNFKEISRDELIKALQERKLSPTILKALEFLLSKEGEPLLKKLMEGSGRRGDRSFNLGDLTKTFNDRNKELTGVKNNAETVAAGEYLYKSRILIDMLIQMATDLSKGAQTPELPRTSIM